MRLGVLLVLCCLLVPSFARAGERSATAPSGDESTSVAGIHVVDACHSPSVDLTGLGVSWNETHVTLVATLAGPTGVPGATCGVLPVETAPPTYALRIGVPDERSDRLSVTLVSTGPGTWADACVEVTRQFDLGEGQTPWWSARGCHGQAYLDGDKVVMTAPMRGVADFGSDAAPLVVEYAVLPEERAIAYAQARSPSLAVSDMVTA